MYGTLRRVPFSFPVPLPFPYNRCYPHLGRLPLIIGIGIDLCKISRMSRAIEKGQFVHKVFSAEEVDYAEAARNPATHYASAFAAKEAFAKAGRWGLSKIGLQSVWVSRERGFPELKLSPSAKRLLELYGDCRVFLSISHENDMAIAVVVLETSNDPLL